MHALAASPGTVTADLGRACGPGRKSAAGQAADSGILPVPDDALAGTVGIGKAQDQPSWGGCGLRRSASAHGALEVCQGSPDAAPCVSASAAGGRAGLPDLWEAETGSEVDSVLTQSAHAQAEQLLAC